jgi:hypothetical protein
MFFRTVSCLSTFSLSFSLQLSPGGEIIMKPAQDVMRRCGFRKRLQQNACDTTSNAAVDPVCD